MVRIVGRAGPCERSAIASSAWLTPDNDFDERHSPMHLASILICVALSSSSEVEEQVRHEIERLHRCVSESTVAARLRKPAETKAALESLAAALENGSLMECLERLSPVREAIVTAQLRGTLSQQDGKPRSMDSVHPQVAAEILRITERDETIVLAIPAAVQALIDAACVQAEDYLLACGPQGKAVGEETGFYYLATARAHADYARFLKSLPHEDPLVRPPKLPELSGLLARIESGLLELYKPPAALGNHRDFIVASAKLKFARELFESGRSLASLRQALEAGRGLHRLKGGGQEAGREQLLQKIDEQRNDLESQDIDHSLATVLLDSAESVLLESSSSADEERMARREAAIAIDHLVPAYLECLRDAGRESVADHPTPSVTLTIVRWPFT